MKKTNKPNPLKFFNDNKEMAYKKAGGEMATYKKSLKKFQGDVTGSQVATGDDEAAKARAALAKAAALANTISMQNTNTNNVDLVNTERMHRRLLDEQAKRFGTKPTKIISAEEAAKQGIYHKKGGSVGRKK